MNIAAPPLYHPNHPNQNILITANLRFSVRIILLTTPIAL